MIGNTVSEWEDDTHFSTLPTALLTVISRIDEFVQAHPDIPEIYNPALPQESFTRHWDQTKYSHFREMVSSYARRIRDAYLEDDERTSVKKWRDLFGDEFGSLDAAASVGAPVTSPRVVKPRKPYAADARQRAIGRLSFGRAELGWLESKFPALRFEPSTRVISGNLELRAAYDGEFDRLHIGNDRSTTKMSSYLCDSFAVRMELDNLDLNGWPTVYEVGGRYTRIVERERIDVIDLHFYPNGACCLGLQALADRRTSLREFMDELVVPFFYRLSFTDRHGIVAARQDLWAEYSHGDDGLREYIADIANIARRGLGRNEPCACGSGRKYKQCHLDEVDRFIRVVSRSGR